MSTHAARVKMEEHIAAAIRKRLYDVKDSDFAVELCLENASLSAVDNAATAALGVLLSTVGIMCCRGCGKTLLTSNATVADGCPCNSTRGINHGVVPKSVCTCVICDPAQTGASRWTKLSE